MAGLPFTVSGIARVRECPASCVLPRVDSTSDDAERGTDGHAFAARVASGMSVAEALTFVPKELKATCANLDVRRAFGDLHDVRVETAFGLNVDTGDIRDLGRIEHRAYPEPRGRELFGTEDLGGVRFDGVPVVADWKFGFLDVEPVRTNPQLSTFSRIRSVLADADRVEGRVITVKSSGRVELDRHVFDAFDLECFEAELREIADRVEEARRAYEAGTMPTVHRGAWCRYCPAMASCPAHTALARAMLPELEGIAGRIAAMTPEEGGRAWVLMKTVKRLAETVEDGLKHLAARSPLPLGNGKEVRPLTMKKASFDRAAAEELLRFYGASDAEIEALETTTSYEQFRELNAPGRDLRSWKKSA